MSQSIVEKVANEIYKQMTFGNNLNAVNTEQEIKDHYYKTAKVVIGALRDIPIDTFDTMTESLVWIKIIDKIGKDIATGK